MATPNLLDSSLESGESDAETPCLLPPIEGTNGADTLLGSGGSQHLSGLNGNDSLCGGAGSDCLEGATATTSSTGEPAGTCSTGAMAAMG